MSNVSRSSSSNPIGAARGVAETVLDKGREVRETVQQMGCAAKDMAQAGWESARDTAAEYLDKGREKAAELGETLESQIRTRPLRALLVAVGLGFLAGIFLKRHR